LPGEAPTPLAETSPFLPAGAEGTASADSAVHFELRGIMATAGGNLYCIYDTARKRSAWVGLNEKGHPFTIRSSDPFHDAVVLDEAGQEVRLALRSAKVMPLAYAGPAQSAAANQSPAAAGGPPDPTAEAARRFAYNARYQRILFGQARRRLLPEGETDGASRQP
jgi:hypothetical protein